MSVSPDYSTECQLRQPKEYRCYSIQLSRVDVCRDLGITVTSDLSLSQHINEIVSKAHQRANHIIRCFVSDNMRVLVRAFIVCVRPILEYNSVIWSPSLRKDIDAIERCKGDFPSNYRDSKIYRMQNLYSV